MSWKEQKEVKERRKEKKEFKWIRSHSKKPKERRGKEEKGAPQ